RRQRARHTRVRPAGHGGGRRGVPADLRARLDRTLGGDALPLLLRGLHDLRGPRRPAARRAHDLHDGDEHVRDPAHGGDTARHRLAGFAREPVAMTVDQIVVFVTIALALVFFVWGRWRYDLVSTVALLVLVVAGVVPVDEAFTGFAHPAVVTVASVMIIMRALQNAGVIDTLIGLIAPARGRRNLQIGLQTVTTASLSTFMNNVGALAIMLPVGLRNAYREKYAPARSLMLLAFASLLGGLVTLIGTPPNIIVSTIRADRIGTPFAMFDYLPVGGTIA